MPTSATELAAGRSTRLVFLDEAGSVEGWRLLEGGNVVERGEGSSPLPRAASTVLAVPGDQAAIHWLELDEGLAPAQAAAAARLLLADSSAEPLSQMHVAVGRPEAGRTPAALVPTTQMAEWLAAAAAAGLEPDAIVPAPMLLPVPRSGFVRRERGAVADYRGAAAAFTIEPELAEPILAGAPAEEIGEAEFESALAERLASPPLDLLQGPFGRRRDWRIDRGRLRRIALFALALALLTFAVQVATILSYTFGADRARTETDALAARAGRPAGEPAARFGALAATLFESVRATPNAELARLDYGPDGSLVATVTTDSPATLAALQGRLEASGLGVVPGERSNTAGRAATELRISAG